MPDSKKTGEIIDIDGIMDVMVTDFAEAVGHGMIVSELSVLVAKELGCDEELRRDIAMAGMLHDIGKLRLGDVLHLKRSEAMVVEKMKYVRLHSAYSRDILNDMGFSESIQDMVCHHHENYDGSGYPDNLSGDAIPAGSRILRVCDVYAALISDRSYRKAFPENTAIELMIEEARHFDMRVLLAFLNVVHSEEYAKIKKLTGNRVDVSAERYIRENYHIEYVAVGPCEQENDCK